MFDDCNNFFKGKADGRERHPAAVPRAAGKGIGSASLLSAIHGVRAQYLHREGVVLSWDSRQAGPGFAPGVRIAGPPVGHSPRQMQVSRYAPAAPL